MTKKKDKGHARHVPEIVDGLMKSARDSRPDGPSSTLHGYRAQLSATITQAGTLLARIDRDAPPPRKPSLVQGLLGSITGAQAARPKRRSWFFAAAPSGSMPDARRIEQLLKAAAKEGSRLSFEDAVRNRQEPGDMSCVLPEGAADPVCEPRK